MNAMFTNSATIGLIVFLATATPAPAEDTVFFVVRHAEKADSSGDPDLSAAGKKRAEQLMRTLEHLRVDAIFHTAFRRTKQTAETLAGKLAITPVIYGQTDQTWINGVVASQKGKRTLIVGHSDTVDLIVNGLTGGTISPIGDHYDNLFIVVISDTSKTVVRLKYGEPH
jgi:broad specificity phosphatase PhoE